MAGRIPPKDTQEAQEIIKRYQNGEVEALWRECGYTRKDTFHRTMKQVYGLEVVLASNEMPELTEESKPEINLPPVKIREYKAPKRKRGDEEVQAVLSSDEHFGKVTRSYNSQVARERMETLFNSILTITNLHRLMYPIRRLWIVKLGDTVQGENPHQGSKLEEVEMGARNQVIKIAVPVWNDFLGSLKQHFEQIDVDCFPGNHGVYDRLAPATSNWDLLFYDILERGIGQEKGIDIHIHDDPSGMDIVNQFDWGFLCLHGDAVPSSLGIPLYGFKRRIKDWSFQFRNRFQYALSAHFHTSWFYEVAYGLEHIGNSTLVSDDPWASKKLGISSKPRQWTFGIHPRKGVSWAYRLIVDKGEFEQVVRNET